MGPAHAGAAAHHGVPPASGPDPEPGPRPRARPAPTIILGPTLSQTPPPPCPSSAIVLAPPVPRRSPPEAGTGVSISPVENPTGVLFEFPAQRPGSTRVLGLGPCSSSSYRPPPSLPLPFLPSLCLWRVTTSAGCLCPPLRAPWSPLLLPFLFFPRPPSPPPASAASGVGAHAPETWGAPPLPITTVPPSRNGPRERIVPLLVPPPPAAPGPVGFASSPPKHKDIFPRWGGEGVPPPAVGGGGERWGSIGLLPVLWSLFVLLCGFFLFLAPWVPGWGAGPPPRFRNCRVTAPRGAPVARRTPENNRRTPPQTEFLSRQ